MPSILIVEDEADIALGLQLELQDECYAVEVSGDGLLASRGHRGGGELIRSEYSAHATVEAAQPGGPDLKPV